MSDNTWALVKKDYIKRATLLFDHVCVYHTPEEARQDGRLSFVSRPPLSFDAMYDKYGLIYSEVIGRLDRNFPLDLTDAVLILDDLLHEQQVSPSHFQGAYTAAIQSIPVVVEQTCTWDQIWEFRSDPEAKQKYRRLRNWIRNTLKDTSSVQAEDMIEQCVDDYRWAIEKHGLHAVIGTLKAVIQPDHLVTVSVASFIAGLMAGTVGATVTAGLTISAHAALELSNFLVQRKDIARGSYSECALIYEIRRQFASE
jgi:hypothetical protein